MKRLARVAMGKARNSLKAAHVLLEAGLPEEAISRAYYTMFNCAKALSLEREEDLSKHSAVIAAFGKNYAATHVLDTVLHMFIREGFDERWTADYDLEATYREGEAEKQIGRAESFLTATEQYLQAHPDEEAAD